MNIGVLALCMRYHFDNMFVKSYKDEKAGFGLLGNLKFLEIFFWYRFQNPNETIIIIIIMILEWRHYHRPLTMNLGGLSSYLLLWDWVNTITTASIMSLFYRYTLRTSNPPPNLRFGESIVYKHSPYFVFTPVITSRLWTPWALLPSTTSSPST